MIKPPEITEMKKFEFKLNKKQTQKVEYALEKAYLDFDLGKPGAVFGQVGQFDREGPVIIAGFYLPREYVERIIKIIKEFIDSQKSK